MYTRNSHTCWRAWCTSYGGFACKAALYVRFHPCTQEW